MKLTGWYRGNQKPVRVGVYERDYGSVVSSYCFWDGRKFSMGFYTLKKAEDFCGWESNEQNLPWRGVAKGKSQCTNS
jgi:hypothetical protein